MGKKKQSASQDGDAQSYRTPMRVTAVRRYPDCPQLFTYPICPRCGSTMDREYQAYCDRCGQALDWKYFSKAVVITTTMQKKPTHGKK